MMNGALTQNSLTLHFSPIISETSVILLTLAGLALMLASIAFFRSGALTRALVFSTFLLLLLNPSVREEERKPVKDTGFIVVDKSYSQSFGHRNPRTQRALSTLKSQIEKSGTIDIKIVEAPNTKTGEYETRLFDALAETAANIPAQQRAGVVFLTDGQIHDIPQTPETYAQYGPIHALLSGDKNEKDRQITLTKAPAYGLVGKDVTIQYRIDDTSNINAREAEVTLTLHDGSQMGMVVPTNTEQTLILKLDQPGQNVFMLEAQGVKDELTLTNNKTAIMINGVRDRLKVLLVSGVPHAGERPWRDLLTSDPGVDLVHFTILREPNKFDFTPQDELSLIAFPVQELFEEKLYDFDLIIFDHYRQNNILPDYYFDNIVQYVKRGGAFLEASGPTFASSKQSIYTTPLHEILPAEPTGEIISSSYIPKLSPLGVKHPVTAGLVWNNTSITDKDTPPWGPWLRQIDVHAKRGDILMRGVDDKPLMILDRYEKGRVAQIASDHLWLWARGYEGGGPHAELLRRLVHWLMKEPELDERALEISIAQKTVTLRKQDFGQGNETIAVTTPEGESATIDLTPGKDNWLEGHYDAKTNGIYGFEDTSGQRKYAMIGPINPPELRSVKTTADKLKPLVQATGGTTLWLSDTAEPGVRYFTNAPRYGGSSWIAFRQNRDYSVTGARDIPLMPEPLRLCMLFALLGFLWWREGQTK